jgi:23S rRNA pseudouridine2605 synthase
MSADHLVKILAERGVASRRASERLIREGHVQVDGHSVTEPGTTVDAAEQLILVDGHRLPPPPAPLYFLLHKPKGVITTREDPEGRKTVFDLLPEAPPSLASVGRLDYGTEGVLLLTNDGELAHRLTHPSYGVPKTYVVKVKGSPDSRKLQRIARGVTLDDGPTRPALVTMIRGAGPSSWLLVTITEGRNRIVRRLMDHIGHETLKLKRVAFGGITLRGLEPGQIRELTRGELLHLRRLVAKPGKAELKLSWDVKRAVAETLGLPLPSRDDQQAPRPRDEEGRPYRPKGWARPKAKKPKPLGRKKAAAKAAAAPLREAGPARSGSGKLPRGPGRGRKR